MALVSDRNEHKGWLAFECGGTASTTVLMSPLILGLSPKSDVAQAQQPHEVKPLEITTVRGLPHPCQEHVHEIPSTFVSALLRLRDCRMLKQLAQRRIR